MSQQQEQVSSLVLLAAYILVVVVFSKHRITPYNRAQQLRFTKQIYYITREMLPVSPMELLLALMLRLMIARQPNMTRHNAT